MASVFRSVKLQTRTRLLLSVVSALSAVAATVFLIVNLNILPQMSAVLPKHVEVHTKELADRIQSDLRSEVEAREVTTLTISSFLRGSSDTEFSADGYEPPVIDYWGSPYQTRDLTNEEGAARLGIYSLGPDGVTRSEGEDADDISSWNSVDNSYWHSIHTASMIRRRLKIFFASGVLAVATLTFYLTRCWFGLSDTKGDSIAGVTSTEWDCAEGTKSRSEDSPLDASMQ